jgi:site-specific DNA-methyltransferase (adenine-specific)
VKGKKPKTFNPKQVPKSYVYTGNPKFRQKNGDLVKKEINNTNTMKNASNVWMYANQGQDKIAHQHPAIFPEKLAEDHIHSWSNEGDIVFDPFMGSGTTAKMAQINNRKYLGFEISPEYIEIINKRLESLEDFS